MKYICQYPNDTNELIALIKTGNYNKSGINTHIRVNNREHELDEYLCFLDLTTYEYKNLKISDKIEFIKSDILEQPICCICGKKHYITYRPYCSSKCYKKSNEYRNILSIAHKNRWKNITDEEKKKIYDKVAKTNIERYGSKCSLNGKELIEKKKQTWLNNYGVDNPLKSTIIKEKVLNTNILKYNSICPLNGKELIEKKKQTWLNNYGVDNPMKSTIIKEKVLETLYNTYGVKSTMLIPGVYDKVLDTIETRTGYRTTGLANPIYKEKILNTNIERYGNINPFYNNSVKEKILNTNIERYGNINPMQNEMIYKKCMNALFNRNIITINNKQFICQGYESIVLSLYLVHNYDVNDIINDISFMFSLNIQYELYNTNHIYIPDFYITSLNLIIEVKSEYTYNPSNDVLYKNLKKAEATINNGYKFLLIVAYKNNKNILQNIIEKRYEDIKVDFEKNYKK